MPLLILLLIVLVIYMLVMPGIAAAQANRALNEVERLRREVRLLQAELARLERTSPGAKPEQPAEQRTVLPEARPVLEKDAEAMRHSAALLKAKPAAAGGTTPPLVPSEEEAVATPPLPVRPVPVITPPVPGPGPKPAPVIPQSVWDAPPSPAARRAMEPEEKPALEPKRESSLTLEQFMGVKLFAWIGGLALFIGIVLFVKYAFEHNLIPPAMRTAIGAVIGLSLAMVGARLRRNERYHVLAQTLAATGVLILYGVSFAGQMLYDLYPEIVAFAMAAVITAGAFVLAVVMEAQVVAVLGMLGGFLAPVLLSTGKDHPLALFGYITALDAGILALVHVRDWRRLTGLAALGTGAMVLGWVLKFWEKSGYAFGGATLVPAAVLLFFPLLFCAAGWWLTRRTERSVETLLSSAGLSWLGVLLSFVALTIPSVTDRPWLLFGFVFLQYILTGAAAYREGRLMPACMTAGAAVFLLLAVWAGRTLTADLLPHALALFLIFGALQTAFPLLWRRTRQDEEPLPPASLWMPLPVLILLLIGVLRVPESPTAIWLAILTVNILLLVLGKFGREATPAVAGFVATLVTLFVWMMTILVRPELMHSIGGSVMPVVGGFAVVLTAGGLWLRAQWKEDDEPRCGPRMLAAIVPVAGSLLLMILATLVLPVSVVADHPWMVFGLIFVQYGLIGWAVMREGRLMPVSLAAGAGVFLLLALWSGRVLTPDLLPLTLTLFVIFGVLQTALPLLWQRKQKEDEALPVAALWMPLPVLVLLLTGVVKVPEATTGIWIAALAVNAALLWLGKRMRQAAPSAAGFGLTLVLLYAWLMAILNRPDLRETLTFFFLGTLAAFAAILTAAGLWLRRQWTVEGEEMPYSGRVLAPVVPSAGAFPLLIMAATSLPRAPFSGLAAIMLELAALVMLSGLFTRLWLLFPVAFGAVFVTEQILHNLPSLAAGGERLAWYPGAWALFLVFPFLRRSVTRNHALPWITAAISGAGQFLLVHPTARELWPNLEPGIIPALCALPPAVALRLLYSDRSTRPDIRLSQLAWFGGIVLLFVTLIVPIQWERQWLTLGWALEGAALCWLYRRVPHEGLRLTGAALLVIAFVRLAFNEAILRYYPRTYPIWNWQLYTYGIAIAAHIAAVRFLDPPRHLLNGFFPVRALFQAQAGVLLFVLINLEIADFFSPTGSPYITWEFAGPLARDMTLTIAWGLYSLGLVAWGLWKRSRGARYAGVGLMGITLLKLFIFDLAGLDSIYRIAVTIVVALIALAVSFLYQRFAARLVREEQG